MNTEVTTAIERLDCVLPLQSGLDSLNNCEAGLYCEILYSYVQTGRALTSAEAAERVEDAESSLAAIAGNKLIVLDANGDPKGAYPFTSEKREHRITVNDITVHCMCALDAMAVSPMFDTPSVIDSECRVSGRPVHLLQDRYRFVDGTLDVCFGIDWDAATSVACCADSLCTEMIFLADTDVAEQWRLQRAATRQLFDLDSALGFAAGFFVPLIEKCRQSE